MTTLLEPETEISAEEMKRFKSFAESGLAEYYAGSASESIRADHRKGNVRTVDCDEPKPTSVRALVAELKASDQDHEWYPTTDEIIRALTRDIGEKDGEGRKAYDSIGSDCDSILDIGAGNGKVLKAVADRCKFDHLHAIEKSSILCAKLSADILIVGTDFKEQSLLSKNVDIVFSNPPYSEFEEWAEKIIRQASAKFIYLVIPQRWENSTVIKDALKFRDVLMPDEKDDEDEDIAEMRRKRFIPEKERVKIVGAFDFEDSEDRTARAKVHLLRIPLHKGRDEEDDAFERFFKEQFADLINRYEPTKPEGDEKEAANAKGGRHRPFHSLVPGPNYPEALVALYRAEMDNVEKNYQLVAQLDVDLLREFEISPKRIMACLKARLSGLKHDYWNELFNRLSAVTDRLTASSRAKLLGTLQRHVQVDFTVTNILEIVLWVIKNANQYLDDQLISTYENMVDKCNVVLYKSNKKVWTDQDWRYNHDRKEKTHYALDYRIVTHRMGGISVTYSGRTGLEERGAEFLGDLLTVARNLGFNCPTNPQFISRSGREQWRSGAKQEFNFLNKQGEAELLFDVRAFQNGNLHLRLNQSFILALNVEHGRLKGWLRTAKEAVEELQDPKAAQYFNGNLRLGAGNPMLLLT